MKDMELYDSFIRETTDLLGAPTQKWMPPPNDTCGLSSTGRRMFNRSACAKRCGSRLAAPSNNAMASLFANAKQLKKR